MKILAIVPARGGSKRIPGKNIKDFNGRPLIAWTIDLVKDMPEICEVIVSTDSPEIADVARGEGASVPWLRPIELATDTATSVDVCLHALNWYENIYGEVDGLLLLQPTSPFRTRESILRGIEIYRTNEFKSVIGVAPALSHPMACLRLEENAMKSFMGIDMNGLRAQDLPPAYVVNGTFYLSSPKNLRSKRSFYAEDNVPLIIDEPMESMDIDTEWDWKLAESIRAMTKI